MQRRGRSFPSPLLDMPDLHLTLEIFWAVAERISVRSRHRHLRACLKMTDPDVDTWEDGAQSPEPSDD